LYKQAQDEWFTHCFPFPGSSDRSNDPLDHLLSVLPHTRSPSPTSKSDFYHLSIEQNKGGETKERRKTTTLSHMVFSKELTIH
jgi:hypothetical protein